MILHGIISLLTSLSFIVSLFAGVVATSGDTTFARGAYQAACNPPGISQLCDDSVLTDDARLPVRYLLRHVLPLAQRFSGGTPSPDFRTTEGRLSSVKAIPPQSPHVAEHIYLLQAELLI